MIEDSLEKLKSEYHSIVVPDYMISHGWMDLSLKLQAKSGFTWRIFFVRGLIFASFVFFVGTGIIGVSQAAKPGDVLFPVKVLSEKAAIAVGVDPQISVVRRADDLIDLSKNNASGLQKASDAYQKTLDESKQDAVKSGNTKEFKQTLEKQEQKFTEAQKESEDSKELKRAIEETAKVQGEVKGSKDSNRQNTESHENNSDRSEDSNRDSGDEHRNGRSGD